jgi:uncharacterized protein (TIGR02284 family)
VPDEVVLLALEDLLETLRDGAKGFALAIRDNREPGVAGVLREGEESCRTAAVELQDQMRLLGGTPRVSGAGKHAVHRGWINFKAVPISRGTKSILEECERGGDYALGLYRDARQLPLPEAVQALIERQHQRLVAFQQGLRLLRNRYSATDSAQASGYSDRR